MLLHFSLCNCSVVKGFMKHQSNSVSALSFHLIDLSQTFYTVVTCSLDSLKLHMMKFLYFNYFLYKFIYWNVEIMTSI